jgi:2-C-methyl-D-erythritol 2,4-cyclodiphosphate synthase
MNQRLCAQLRIGQGIDVHRLVEGRPLILGGVNIPFEKGLDGHSDADALVHAIIDALLGACGKGDIGQQFPDTDPTWKGADSIVLMKKIWSDLTAEGWQLINIDSNICAEAPKMKPFIPEMKKRIAEVLGVQPDDIGIKAGTFERMGFVGNREGIMATAVALLSR